MMEYPIPERHRFINQHSIELLIERNDSAAWASAVAWLDEADRWTKFYRDRPNAKPGHGLVLVGPVGTGKTTIASVWLSTIEAKTKYTVAFITDFELAALLRQRYDDEARQEVYWLQNVGFLAVDDLMRMGTHTMPLEVEGFLRVRENNGLPTIVTLNTNVRLPDTLNSLMTTWAWATFDGADLRDPRTTDELKKQTG